MPPVPAAARAQGRDSLLVPFTMEQRAADATSLDLSFLFDAPTGSTGACACATDTARGNTPKVNDPLRSTVVRLSRTAVAGKPYTVSEFSHPFPNDWA